MHSVLTLHNNYSFFHKAKEKCESKRVAFFTNAPRCMFELKLFEEFECICVV